MALVRRLILPLREAGAEKMMLNEAMLNEFKRLVVCEAAPAVETQLEHLTAAEREVLDGLRSGRWGLQPRLEQERLP